LRSWRLGESKSFPHFEIDLTKNQLDRIRSPDTIGAVNNSSFTKNLPNNLQPSGVENEKVGSSEGSNIKAPRGFEVSLWSFFLRLSSDDLKKSFF
jgi:hypothetical protein